MAYDQQNLWPTRFLQIDASDSGTVRSRSTPTRRYPSSSAFQNYRHGKERSVAFGRIDITARDSNGRIVVIELKAGEAGRDAIGRILSYMGDLGDEYKTPIRGILVAGESQSARYQPAGLFPSFD
ncbi:MAG: endonuclease NucS [Acidobacteriota bacterium]|nr:endonuclease NucS [Acidobacteriota bacterium]